MATGEWEIRNTVMTPLGPQTTIRRYCHQKPGVCALILPRTSKVACTVRHSSRPDASGTFRVSGVCVPPGAPLDGPTRPMLHAEVSAAADGRCCHGTARATDTLDGRSLPIAPTRATRRYVGACKRR